MLHKAQIPLVIKKKKVNRRLQLIMRRCLKFSVEFVSLIDFSNITHKERYF